MAKSKDSTTTKSHTRKAGTTVAAVASLAGMVFTATPASAIPHPTSTFSIEAGASYYRGTVTWYDRSVGVTGTLKTVGCWRVYLRVFADTRQLDYLRSGTQCDKTTNMSSSLSANVAGGADTVYIQMTETSQNIVKGATCVPSSSVCENS